METIYQVSQTKRITVEPALYYYPIEELSGDVYGIVTLSCDRFLTPINHGELSPELNKILDNLAPEYGYTNQQRVSAIGKYLTLSGYKYHTANLRGYSQGDWHNVIIYSNLIEPSDAKQELETWYRGDVYNINLQELEYYQNMNDEIDIITEWRTKDSYGYNLIADTPELFSCVKDYFGIDLSLATAEN